MPKNKSLNALLKSLGSRGSCTYNRRQKKFLTLHKGFYASEGFSSPEKFLGNIKSIYPHLKLTDKINLIEFRFK